MRRTGSTSPSCQGGPQVSNRHAAAAGKIDFYMGGNLLQAFDASQQDIPHASWSRPIFQKEPQVLMSHPGQGLDTFAGSEEADTISSSARTASPTFLQWMKHGLRLHATSR